MGNADFLGQGLKFPFIMENGSLAMSSGYDSIRESILIILRTTKGERLMRPDFGCGIYDFVFHPINATTLRILATEVEEALLKFEPRIDVNRVKVYPDPDVESRLIIEIEYTVRAFNAKENLVFPFYLENR